MMTSRIAARARPGTVMLVVLLLASPPACLHEDERRPWEGIDAGATGELPAEPGPARDGSTGADIPDGASETGASASSGSESTDAGWDAEVDPCTSGITSGDVKWRRTFGGSGIDRGEAIAVGPGGAIAVTGRSQAAGIDGVFVVRSSSNGDLEWQRSEPSTHGAWGRAIAFDAADQIIVASTETLSITPAEGDAPATAHRRSIVTTYDTGGEIVWTHVADDGENVDEQVASMAIEPGGTVALLSSRAVAGALSMRLRRISEAGDLLFSTAVGPNEALLGARDIAWSSGGWLVSGSNAALAWIGRVAPSGETVWSTDAGRGDLLAIDADGSVVLVGSVRSGGDDQVWMARLDATGERLWSRSWGGAMHDAPHDLAIDFDGSVIVVGWSRDQHTSEGWVRRLDGNGELLWHSAISDQAITGVAVGGHCQIVVTGSAFDPPATQSIDILIAELAR